MTRAAAAFACLCSCGVAETGVLLCPSGTTSTIEGCVTIGPQPDGGTTGAGEIEMLPFVTFFRAAAGGVYEQPLPARNVGTAPVTLTLVRLEGNRERFAYDVLAPGDSITLQPGERLDADVRYIPRRGDERALFVFSTCSLPECELTVEASGFGVEEAFSCRGDFGALRPGECNFTDVVCSNETNYTVTLDGIGYSGSRAFFVEPQPVMEVQPFGAIFVPVRFCPLQIGDHRATMELMAQVPGGRNTTSHVLRGEGLGSDTIQCMPDSVKLGMGESESAVCFALETVTIEQMIFVPGSAPGLVGRLYLDGVHVFPPVQVGPTDVIEVEIENGAQLGFQDELHLIHTNGVEIIAVETTPDREECFIDYPAFVDFGSVSVGNAFNASAELRNIGFSTCEIETVGFDAATDPAFALLTPVPTVTLLDVGQSMELFVADFFPTRLGPHTGTFLFREGTDDYFVGLLGEGVEPGGYTIEFVPGVPLMAMGGSTVVFTNADDGFAQIGIGFPFQFDGVPATDAYLSSNGLLAFDSAGVSSLTNLQIPASASPNGFIAWWWDDLRADHPQGNATVTTSLSGMPGAQVRTFTLLDMAAFGNNTPVFDVEIRLYEQTQIIEVHYGSIMLRGVDFSGSVGWESRDGFEGDDAFGCSPGCTSANWFTDSILRYVPN